VVPVLRSGGYLPSLKTEKDGGLKVGDDLLGYELDYYSVEHQSGGGIRVVFERAELVSNGRSISATEPRLDLFGKSDRFRFARLWHLMRDSNADHDMLLLFTSDEATLDRLTAAIKSGDTQSCRAQSDAKCISVPLGVAIVPEERRHAGTSIHKQWVPVR
jgi:hypothetical protein